MKCNSWKPLFILLYMPLLLLAQHSVKHLQPADIFNIEKVSNPRISPDGKTIVYVREFSDIMTDRRYANLWVVQFDGSNHRPLTSGHYYDSAPRWSPDGKQLLFISNRDSKTSQLYLIRMKTEKIVRLTHIPESPRKPAWSPDGKQIAFIAFVPETRPSLINMPPAPKGAQWAKPAREIDKIIYRTDWQEYLPHGYSHLFVLPAEGGTPRQITTPEQHLGPAFVSHLQSTPQWTPDGKSIIISTTQKEGTDLEMLDSEVYEFSLSNGSVKTLTHARGYSIRTSALSPNGKHIAYLIQDIQTGYKIIQLGVMNRDGSAPEILSTQLDRGIMSIQWARDNKGIYFLYDDQGNSKLGYLSLKKQFRRIAKDIGNDILNAYSYGQFHIGPRQKFVITSTRPDNPSDLAVGKTHKSGYRQITFINQDLLADKTLGKVEEIRYKSAFDGRSIQGWIIRPPHFDPARKYPLILEIHGGPYANYGSRFDFEKQLMAAKGYVVLYVNPRGSTSYGQEFIDLIHQNYPGNDHDDLISGVDAMLKKDYIDENNLFITGGSGGGILTCWITGQTQRFRAAAALFPVFSWSSVILVTDFPMHTIKNMFPGFPWDHPTHYFNHSPLSKVKHVKTPTMLLTGEQDYRTPISESEQYYRALKLLNVESVLIRMPAARHAVYGPPSHWMAKMLYVTEWFEKHRMAQDTPK